MRVAIVHYHLAPGGVTRVIEAASQALDHSSIRHVILTGEQLAGLGYLKDPGDLTAEELTSALRSAATEALGGVPDIWHFHNHSLGKNCLIADVIARLASENARLVLQIHDLAEAGRPKNYSLIADSRNLYPFSPCIRYVFLNARDRQIFTNSGLPEDHSCILENCVDKHGSVSQAASSTPVLFAPIRGIRRKNIGELALLSALAPAGTWFAVSRAPLNPDSLPIHDQWQKFAKRHRLTIEYNVVERLAPAANTGNDYESWVARATHFVTTSVAEGFGLPFLEAIAHGKPLIGRNLPHLTEEHACHGITHGHLYDRLLIPIDWVDLTILRDYLSVNLERNYRAYRIPLPADMIEMTISTLSQDDLLDFGNLPESLQQAVIERITSDPANQQVPLVEIQGVTESASGWLASAITNRVPSASLEHLGYYSPARYQSELLGIYQSLMDAPTDPVLHLDPRRILTSQLSHGNFHFLLSAQKSPNARIQTCRAVIFDIYGTLLIAPHGGVRIDSFADPVLREILRSRGFDPPVSPSRDLYEAVLRHHSAADVAFPEVDLRILWREVLHLEAGTDTTSLVQEIEEAWHPSRLMPGAEQAVGHLARSGLSLGLLSNAQCNTLASLGGLADLFAPELSVLSYQHGLAKPAPELFQILIERLAGHGIIPSEAIFVGNDPLQDIVPAAAAGFQTALFTGHSDSIRQGDCSPDFSFQKWPELIAYLRGKRALR
jgi:FMN phosphatase YigB (HAD superfamily)/glycosyltransferase involved in cell wall biosynthesis